MGGVFGTNAEAGEVVAISVPVVAVRTATTSRRHARGCAVTFSLLRESELMRDSW
jgi:hypothetical protein